MDATDPSGRFEDLVLPHLSACFNFARWLLRSSPDAEDCVQEAMIRALRAIDQFRGGDARPWLMAIVRNQCYTLLRRAPPAALSLEDSPNIQPPDPAPNPEAALFQKAERQRLRTALEELPAEFREVLLLKEFEGLSYKEIAEVIEAPIGTVMSRLSRARQRLLDRLRRTGETA